MEIFIFSNEKILASLSKKRKKAPDADTQICVSHGSFFVAGFKLLASLAARASSYAFYVSGDQVWRIEASATFNSCYK